MDRPVSIRSPHKSKGRPDITTKAATRIQFQSAPLTKARGDPLRTVADEVFLGFNPLPSQKQGETLAVGYWRLRGEVSIRSPHKSKGRPHVRYPKYTDTQFQSAPLTKARGDIGVEQDGGLRTSFNPLPSQKQGETSQIASPRSAGRRFNPLPSQKQGETRPSASSEPAPRSFNPLPSQKQGETRRIWQHHQRTVHVSIRSPHKSKGRRLRAAITSRLCSVSIRSPHKSKGRPIRIFGIFAAPCVSIRSPHKSKGRQRRSEPTR